MEKIKISEKHYEILSHDARQYGVSKEVLLEKIIEHWEKGEVFFLPDVLHQCKGETKLKGNKE